MASVSHDSASSTNLQFEDVEEALDIHINLSSPEMQIFQLKERAIDGKYYRLDYQTAGNAYMAARAEGEYHPGYDPASTAEDGFGTYTVNELKFYNRWVYHSLDFTGQMKTAVKSRKGGYKNLVDFRFDDTVKHMEEQVAIKLATSQLGTRGKIQSITTTAVTLYYAGTALTTQPQLYEGGSRYIRAGMRLDAASSRTAVLRTGAADRGRQVTAVAMDTGSSTAGPVVTLNSAPTAWAADDFLFIYKERQVADLTTGTSEYQGKCYSPLGLMDAVDDGDISPYYGGVDRTASGNESLKAIVFDNGSSGLRDLTHQLLNQSVERVKQLSGGEPNIFYSPFGVQRNFVNFLTLTGAASTASDNPMRFNQPGAKQKIGFNSFDVFPLGMSGALRFMPSRLAPHHTGFLLEQGSGVFLRDGPPGFLDEDGQKIRKTKGLDAYTADWKMTAAGFVVKAPWRNCRIDDLSGSHME